MHQGAPMRVAHLLSGDLWAGAEVASFHLVRALQERDDVAVRVVVLNPGTLLDRLRGAGVPTDLVPEQEHPLPALARRVRRVLAGADLVHAHRYKENLLAALSGRPWLSTVHGRPEPLGGAARARMAVYMALDRWLLRRSARRAVAVSDEVAEWLATRLPPQRIVRIWNGIEDPRAGLAVPPAPWADRPLRVGVLGRLAPVKGYALAVETVARCPGIELEVVGDGPERPALESLARARGAGGRVRFLGHQDAPLERVAGWRAMLVTSLHEGNPIGVLEALGLGTPVVSGPLRGLREALAGEGGIEVPAGRDPEVWARALGALLADEAAGRAHSEAARRRFLAAFRRERCAEALSACYRELLEAA